MTIDTVDEVRIGFLGIGSTTDNACLKFVIKCLTLCASHCR